MTTELGTDECVPNYPTPEDSWSYSYVEAGSVDFVSGATTLHAPRYTFGPSYEFEATGSYPADARYEVSIEGFTNQSEAQVIGTIDVPRPVDFVGGVPQIVSGQDLEVTFTPNTGADVVWIYLYSGQNLDHICNVEPDGSFVIPASVTSDIGGNPIPGIAMRAISYGSGTIVLPGQERKVRLMGSTGP